VQPEVNFAHPLDGGGASVAYRSLAETAAGLGPDGPAYRRLFEPLVEHGQDVVDFFLTSRLRRLPTRSVPQIAHFGLNGLPNVRWLAHRYFETEGARALLGGAAAHGMLDLTRPLTSALGMLLTMLGHHVGWPLVEGGSQNLADAMVTALEQQGGEVETDHLVTDLREFDGVPAVLLDTTPRPSWRWPATGCTRATAAGWTGTSTVQASSRSTGSCPSRCPGPTPTCGGPGPSTSPGP
jgi:phytoene dehydrogenase-like protein